MAVNLSPVGGVAAQFFNNSGSAVLTGGKLYTYAAGTTTPAVTYTSSNGATPWTNPVVLDAAGRVPGSGEIWLTDGLIYKFVLKDSNDVLIATYDNITGINSNSVSYTNQQEIVTATAGQTVFNLGISYQPATNSLSVFVDGVNQYGPGAQYSYVETDSTTVTFNSGLHVGAEVKFTTTQQQGAGAVDASQVSYEPPFTGSAATNVEAKLAQTVSVKDFGAVGDWDGSTGTDDTAAIQTAIDALDYSQALYFPQGNYRLTQTLTIPTLGVKVFFGDGSLSTVLVMDGASANTDIFARADTSPLEANNINGVYFHDLAFSGYANSRHGINWLSMSRSFIQNCRFDSLAGAAIYNTSSLVVAVNNCVMNSCGYGIYGTGTGWTGMNGWNIHNCYISLSTHQGIYIAGGVTGSNFSGNTLESNALGGVYIGQDAEGVTFDGCYFEENKTALTSTYDISLGSNSFVASIGIRNCYFNSDSDATNFYYPIRLKYVYSSVIENNVVNVGGKFIAIESSSSLGNNTFGKVHFWGGAYVPFNDFQPTIYFSDAAAATYFVAGSNRITKDFNPSFAQGDTNLGYVGEFPYGGWTAGLPGSSTFTRYPNTGSVPGKYNGNQSIGLLYRSGGTATLTKAITVNNSNAPIVKNAMVTFALDVYGDSASPQYFTLNLNDGGSQTFTASFSTTQSWATFIVSGHFSNATTALNAVMSTSTNGSYWVANPRIFACADQSLMQGFSGTPYFANTAAPTSGTWAVGDIVWNSSPSSGNPAGWMCTVAGTPGTWKAMANLA